MIAELAALARPLWAYTGDFATADGGTAEQTKVVGTVVAGRQDPESSIGWNAMFWGFGLEGVGEGAEGTVSQTRLLGDTFNFLVHNFAPTGPMAVELENDPAADGTARLGMVFPEVATAPRVEELTIDWGDGSEAETRAFVRPVAADQLVLDHGYAAEGSYEVVVHVLPAAHAAPFTVAGTIEADAANLTPTIYLPTVANAYDPAAEAVDPGAGPFGAGAGAWRPRARAVRPIAR